MTSSYGLRRALHVLSLSSVFALAAEALPVRRDVGVLIVKQMAAPAMSEQHWPSYDSVSSERPMALASFPNTVLNVVVVRAEEEMVNVYAQRQVASVANVQPVGDRTVRSLPRESMCQDGSAARVSDATVSIVVDCTEPEQTTSVGLGNGAIRKPLIERVSMPSAVSDGLPHR